MLDLRLKIHEKNSERATPQAPIPTMTPSWELSRDPEAQRRALLESMHAALAAQAKDKASFLPKLKAVTPLQKPVETNLQDGGQTPHQHQEHEVDEASAKRMMHLMQTHGHVDHHNFANRFRQRDR